jgi:hypothetical protein
MLCLRGEILDFKDPDSSGYAGGVEPSTYPYKSYGPKNGPFAAVAEVDQLPFMTDSLYKELAPNVTVYSQQQGFDPAAAPESLLQILGVKARTDSALSQFSSPSSSKVFSIDVVVQTKQKARFYRKAIVALLQQPDRPYATLTWERGRETADWVLPKDPRQPCVN